VGPGPGGGFEARRGSGHARRRREGLWREQEELGSLFGVTLREGDSVARLVRSKHLRPGEVAPLSDDDKQKVAGRAAGAGRIHDRRGRRGRQRR